MFSYFLGGLLIIYLIYYFVMVGMDIYRINKSAIEEGAGVDVDISTAVAGYKPVDAGEIIRLNEAKLNQKENPLIIDEEKAIEEGIIDQFPEDADDGNYDALLDDEIPADSSGNIKEQRSPVETTTSQTEENSAVLRTFNNGSLYPGEFKRMIEEGQTNLFGHITLSA